MKKNLLLLALLMMLFLILAGCDYSLPASFDEDELTATACQVIELLSSGDYASVSAMLREDLQPSLDAAALEEELGPLLADLGAFQSFTASATAGTRDKDTKEPYGVIVVACRYQNGSADYTMYFDESMALVGLYLK